METSALYIANHTTAYNMVSFEHSVWYFFFVKAFYNYVWETDRGVSFKDSVL
jgi:hypothetical protein